jgi:hypothetical protein
LQPICGVGSVEEKNKNEHMKYILLLTVVFVSCQKQEAKQDGTFIIYKTGAPLSSWSVLINGANAGLVPYVQSIPTCNSNQGLQLKYKPGTYTIDFKSNDGYAWGNPKQVTLGSGECKPYPLQ